MPRILLVTHSPPWPPNNGGQQRTNLLLRALRACGQVDLLLIARSPRERPSEEALRRWREEYSLLEFCRPLPRGRYWPWKAIRFLRPALVDACAGEWGDPVVTFHTDPYVSGMLRRTLEAVSYDLVVGRYLKPTALSGAFAYAPLVLDVDDLDSDRCASQIPATPWWSPLRRVLRRHLRQLSELEPALLPRCEGLWVCSEADRAKLGAERIAVLPNIPFCEPQAGAPAPCPPTDRTAVVLLVGSLMYGVNVRGIERFIRHVWPQIHGAYPDSMFRIVGIGMSPAQKRRWARVPGVRPIGFAEDLRDEYAACAFTVAPLYEGAGTKIKVLESFLFGRTSVVTEHAHRGYETAFRDGEALYVAQDDDGFAKACIRLLRDPALCATMAARAHSLVNEHFTFTRFEAVVRETVRRVLDGGNGVVRRDSASF